MEFGEVRSIVCLLALVSLSFVVDRSTCQQTTSPSTPTCPLDVVFVVDHSSSISDNDEGPKPNWSYVVDLINYVVTSLYASSAGQTRFAAVSFGTTASIAFNLNWYSTATDTVNAVNAIANSGGNTNTTGALQLARVGVVNSPANRLNVPDVLVLITDGVPSKRYDGANVTYEAGLLKSAGVVIVGVGVTTEINVTLMQQIVSNSTTDYFDVLNFMDLTSIFASLTSCITSTFSTTSSTTPFVSVSSISSTFTVTGTTPSASTTTQGFLSSPSSTAASSSPAVSTPISTSSSSSSSSSTQSTSRTSSATTTTPATPSTTITSASSASTSTSTIYSSSTPTPTSTPVSSTSPTVTSTPTSATVTVTSTPPTSTVTTPSPSSTSSTTKSASTSTTPLPASTTPRLQIGCLNGFDLVVLLDASGGGINNNANFAAVRQYLSTLISQMEIQNDKVRVGFLMYYDSQILVFNLNTFVGNATAMTTAIGKLRVVGGGTDTGSAIAFALNYMLKTSAGARLGSVQQFIMIVTYGPSNNYTWTESNAYAARLSGVKIIALTIGYDTSYYPEVDSMVSSPPQVTHQKLDTTDMLTQSLRNQTIDLLCNNINECASSPCLNGSTCQDDYGTFDCKCPSGLAGQNCSAVCLTPADIVFVLDTSGSMDDVVDNYGPALRSIISKLNGADRIGIIVFSTTPEIFLNLDNYTDISKISDSLTIWQSGGTTNTNYAIQAASNMLVASRRPGFNQYMIVVTDGYSNDEAATIQAAAAARQNGIFILAVGVTSDPISYPARISELFGIASSPASDTVIVSTTGSFSIDVNSQLSILEIVCQNSGNGCDSSPCRNGGTCTNQPAGTYLCACTNLYTGNNCQRTCPGYVDIVFAIDNTGSIRWNEFNTLLQFFDNIVYQLEIAPKKTRVSALTYSNAITIDFKLGDYTSQRDVIEAIQNIQYSGGRSNISGLLWTLANVAFAPQNGGRLGAPDIVVMVTGGGGALGDPTNRIAMANLHTSGMQFIVIAVGLTSNLAEVSGIASYPQDRNFFVSTSVANLGKNVNGVVTATCNDVNNCSPSPCQSGGTCYPLNGISYCLCPPNYGGLSSCSFFCTAVFDLAIVLDLSVSIDTAIAMFDMVYSLVDNLPISASQVHVSIITFSYEPTIWCYLNNYTTAQQLNNTLHVIVQTPRGPTQTDNALQSLVDEIFVPSNGARPNVPHVAVVVSSGQSWDPSATVAAADYVRTAGIQVYSVAYQTPDAFMGEIDAIASSPLSKYSLSLVGVNDPKTIANTIRSQLCTG